MNILIIGGGVFVGPAVLAAAMARGHTLTVFNRGFAQAKWPQGVTPIVGDRIADLNLLTGQHWDAVIDTCGYRPRELELMGLLLANECDRYVYISSVSAYAAFDHAPVCETDATARVVGPDLETVSALTYGPLKAACERVVQDFFGDRAIILRPGLIGGPNDPTGRLSYWPWRCAAGGRVLAPGRPEYALQFIDVRDLAAWIIQLIEESVSGIFNATGPNDGCTFGELLDTCRFVAGKELEIEWVDEHFLQTHGVEPWLTLPLWTPSYDPQLRGFNQIDTRQARNYGLSTRPLAATLHDILLQGLPWPKDKRLKGKLDRAQERALLNAWDVYRQQHPTQSHAKQHPAPPHSLQI
jgi:2'-hydroxyisoflavone reductase